MALRRFAADWLTVKQVAGLLDCSVRTVWRWEKAGLIPAARRFSNKLVRWRRVDIDRYLARLLANDESE